MSITLQLYNDDAIRVIKALPDNCIDNCITDPPYGIGFKYNEREVFNRPEDYALWLFTIYEQIERVVKPGGLIAVFQSTLYMRYFWEWFGDDIHIYIAAKNFVQLRKGAPISYGYDCVVMKYKRGAAPIRPDNPGRNIDFFVANTAVERTNTTSLARQHPSPKSIDQMRELVRNFTIGSIVDPFMGSGTTAMVCLYEGRNFVGIEVEKEYYELSKLRISEAQSIYEQAPMDMWLKYIPKYGLVYPHDETEIIERNLPS